MTKWLEKLLKRKNDIYPVCSVIVAAAGSSRRMEGENKLLSDLGGLPVLARTLRAISEASLVDEIVIAAREEDLLPFADLCKEYEIAKPVKLVRGGETRQASVYAASLECREDADFIAVHDGARPLVTPDLVDRVIALAHRTNAAALAVPVKDTVKVVAEGRVAGTPDRESLRCVQTPQVFDAQLLKAALQAAMDSGESFTDDCSAVERLGKEVFLAEGSYENIKITTPEDLAVAEALLNRQEELA